MAKIASTFNVGNRENITPERLLELIEEMYKNLAEAVNGKPDFIERSTDGQTDDTFLSQGSLNLNSTTKKVEMLSEHTSATAVTWTTLS